MTPTARTLKALRELGYVAEVVERVLPHSFIRVDFAGCLDIIAFSPWSGIVGVQVTGGDGGNHAARRSKIIAEPRAATWLASGGKIQIWSWRKGGAAGKRKLWVSRTEEILAGGLDQEPGAGSAQPPAA